MFQFSIFQRATEAVDYVRHRLPESLSRPGTGIVCGSGLGGLAGAVDLAPRVEIDYKDIPHFPQSTGTVSGIPGYLYLRLVAAFSGHTNKGHSSRTCWQAAVRVSWRE